MNWKKPEEELPKTSDNKACRCLAEIYTFSEQNLNSWKGYVDVYFRPDQGWKRCETQTSDFTVIKWIYFEEVGED